MRTSMTVIHVSTSYVSLYICVDYVIIKLTVLSTCVSMLFDNIHSSDNVTMWCGYVATCCTMLGQCVHVSFHVVTWCTMIFLL